MSTGAAAVIGRYEIESEIGRGTFGTVYRAWDPRLRRRVALKTFLLPPGLSPEDGKASRERFLREGQAAGGLSHPAIVTVFEVEEDPASGLPFIAMEYVPGPTLKDVLAAEGPMPLPRVLQMGIALAGALQAAHASGIVHRDIKPANLLLREPDGAVKIADFGVARIPTSELTQADTTLGSPAYMSPEQVCREPLDGRSDLFSLAVVLYEALAGRRPFAGENLPALTYSIAHGRSAPISSHRPGLPPAVDAFFEKALARDPAARFQDGEAFARALGEIAAAPEPGAPGLPAAEASPPRRPRRRRLMALLVLGAALALVAGARWLRHAADPATAGAETPPAAAPSAVAAPVVLEEAWLDLTTQSSVKSGTLTLILDDKEVYSRTLSTEPRRVKRFFKKVAGRVQEEFRTRLPVTAGRHRVVARVTVDGAGPGHEESLIVDLEPGQSLALEIVAGRTIGPPLVLRAG